MPIGNSYPRDVIIEDADLFLGTKASLNNTVNYTAQGIANYLNINGKVSISGQMSFKFVEMNDIDGTISFDGGGGGGTYFSDITQLIVSKIDLSEQEVNIFLAYLNGKEILLARQNKINSFGNYKVIGYTVTSNPDFYTLDLQYIGGNGTILKDKYYDLVAFSSSTGGTPYVLPTASLTILGGVKIGSGINVTIDGTISVSTNYQMPLSGTGIVKSTSGTISYISGTSAQYIAGDGSLVTFPTIPTVGTWGALNYPTWTTGTPFVKMTAAGTFALDTNTYLTGITSSDVTTALGYTPVTNARTLTINGVTYDLTADRSWTITSGVSSVTATSPITSSGGATTVISTSMATNKLIGRSTLGVGVMEEITVGSGLTLSGGILTNTATPTALGYYGAFQDNTIQTAIAINTPYAMRFGITDLSNAVTIVSDGSYLTRITIANTGIYNIQFSAQFDRTNSGTDSVDIWLRKNGVDISGTGGKIVLAGGAVASAVIATWNYVLDVVAGDYYQLMWSTPDTHVRLLYEAAQTSPFTHPLIPSTILTVTQQSGIMAGTGVTAINSLTGAAQTLTVGTTGTDFAIVDSGVDHKFNLPTASATNRGALSTTDWATFNSKQNALGFNPYRYVNSTQSIGSAAIGETQLIKLTIPANTFASNDKLSLKIALSKSGIINGYTVRVKLTTSSSMPSGATSQIATYAGAALNQFLTIDRTMGISGGNLKGFTFTASVVNDFVVSSNQWNNVAFDVTQTQYLYVSLIPATTTTDVTYVEFINISNI